MFSFTFHYDRRGHGDLVLRHNGERHREWACRSGSIDTSGKLINAIEPATWKILTQPEWTNEDPMCINGVGWKVRLYNADGEYTHYLIHPDGGKPGSAGCIVTIGTVALPLKDMISQFLKEQQMLLVEVARSKTA